MHLETIITVGYAQLGLLLLGWLVYRRIAELRSAVAAGESNRETLVRGIDEAMLDLERRLDESEKELDRRRAKRAVRRVSGLRRKRALEKLCLGEEPAAVARELELRPPEAEFLARLAAQNGLTRAQAAQ